MSSKASSEYLRNWRKARKEAGLCMSCPSPARPGRLDCQACLAKSLQRRRMNHSRRAEAGLCANCGKDKPAPGIKNCVRCSSLINERIAKASEKAKASGVCSSCKRSPAAEGRKLCTMCLGKHRLSSLRGFHSEFGKWACRVRHATVRVARVSDGISASTFLQWNHDQFLQAFPGFDPLVHQIDHIVSIRCACLPDLKLDVDLAPHLLGLANLQLLTKQDNCLKGRRLDKLVIDRASILRRQGVSGADLFQALREFIHGQVQSVEGGPQGIADGEAA